MQEDAMILILVGWIVLTSIFMTTGQGVQRLLPSLVRKKPSGFDLAWLGIAGLTAGLHYISLFLPMQGIVFYPIVAGSLGFSAWQLVRNAKGIKSAMGTIRPYFFWPLAFLIIIGLAYCSAPASVSIDTDWYHFGTVRWMSEYPAVPGLANLDLSFAINSSLHLLDAFFNNGIFKERIDRILNGYLISLFMMECLFRLFPTNDKTQQQFNATDSKTGRDERVASVCFILLFGLKALAPSINSLEVEVATTIIFCRLFLLFLQGPWVNLPQICLLSILGFCIKQNFAIPLVATVLTLSMRALVFKTSTPDSRFSAKKSLTAVVIAGLGLGIGFAARNAILSGYLLFPITFTRLGLSWGVPVQTVSNFVSHHATILSIDGFGVWLTECLRAGTLNHPLFLTGLGLLALGITRSSGSNFLRTFWFPLLISFVGIAFIGVTHPSHFRFSEGFTWVFFIIGVLSLNLQNKYSPYAVIVVALCFLISLVPQATIWALRPEYVRFKFTSWPIGKINLPKINEVELHKVSTSDQEFFYVPKRLEKEPGFCRYSPLPCVREEIQASKVIWRSPGQLRHGFKPG